MLEDSTKEYIENEYMMQLIEISMHKEEIDFLQQHARVEVSVTQKMRCSR